MQHALQEPTLTLLQVGAGLVARFPMGEVLVITVFMDFRQSFRALV
jgi:hypothetical protein